MYTDSRDTEVILMKKLWHGEKVVLLRNRGLLYGPWLPIYGIGALGIYAMKPIKKHPILLFLLCALVAGIVEYIIGFAGIHFFGVRLWDYRGLFLNISGVICLRSVVSFAVMGILFLYLVEPILESVIVRLNPKTVRTSYLILLLVLIADCILSELFRTPITY